MKRMKNRHESHGARGVTHCPKENSARTTPRASHKVDERSAIGNIFVPSSMAGGVPTRTEDLVEGEGPTGDERHDWRSV